MSRRSFDLANKKLLIVFELALVGVCGGAVIAIFAHNRADTSPEAQIVWQRPETTSALSAPTDDDACSTVFTRYDDAMYYGTTLVGGADPASFLVLQTSNCIAYGKDKHHVYIGFMGYAYQIAPDADPKSFTPYYDARGLILYSKDHSHVYGTPDAAGLNETNTHIQIMQGADSNTFTVLYDGAGNFTGYAKDNQHIYYLLQFLPGADPSSFTVLQGAYYNAAPGGYGNGIPLAKDASHAFYGADIVSGAEPSSFVSVYTVQGFWSGYAEDAHHVYCEGAYPHPIAALSGAVPATFVAESDLNGGWNGYAHDEARRWHMCTQVS